VRITSLSGEGVLSFDQFGLGLSERVTFIAGPNGAGKSNLTRLLTICLRAVESGDGGAGDVDRLLASFLAARHVGSQSPGVEARVAIRLTDLVERELVTEFVRAMVTGALTVRRQVQNMAEIDAWAEAEITEAKLQPLMEGQIVTSHPGTQDGRWQCAYEFTAPGYDQSEHRYQWILLGWQSGIIVDADAPVTIQGSDIATRITGSPSSQSGPAIPVPGGFQLLDLLPKPDLSTMSCTFDLSGTPSGSQRRFAGMAGLPLVSPGAGRMMSLATVLRVIFRRALVQTSDTRLLPSGGASWSASELTLGKRAEAQLPELLLTLKNGDPSERARYQRIRDLFTEFTQGRDCEVRLMPVQQPTEDGQGATTVQVPAIWVTVDASAVSEDLAPEVPIAFAGAGAWEALVLASVLGEPSASIVVLDEPAVALHPSLQRQFGAYLLTAPAQFLVISHSAELLPLADVTDVRLVRLDRDDKNATRAWPVDEACRVKLARKLAAKGNERLPFAWRAILCEGQDDVEALMTLTERMGIDLRRRNIAVTDCGSRDNIPDYVWFCAELGLKYLAVMDADSATPDALPKAQAVREAVNLRHGGELAEFPVSLEATFGVPKQRPSLVPAAIRALSFADDMPDPAQAPAEVVALAQAIRRLTK
jgi:energy-coupling factor transporter ATP-binding protein EcfA2